MNGIQETLAVGARQRTNIAVMMPTWIGDACMATPTLRSLRQQFPDAGITAISRALIREVIDGAWGDGSPWINDWLLFEKRKRQGKLTRFGLARAMRERKFDAVVLLTNSLWSAAVARFSGARTVVGYDRDMRGVLLTDRLPVQRNGRQLKPTSAIDYYLELASWLGGDKSNKSMQLRINAADNLLCENLWTRVGFDSSTPTIVLNSNAATSSPRIWPADKLSELALRIAIELQCQVLLHCGPQEREVAGRIAAEANHPRIASMGELGTHLPIGLTKAVMSRARLVVTSDSGPRHIAVALNRPVVSLFGPTDPRWTITYNCPEARVCAGPERDMAAISVQQVWECVCEKMNRISSGMRVAA